MYFFQYISNFYIAVGVGTELTVRSSQKDKS